MLEKETLYPFRSHWQRLVCTNSAPPDSLLEVRHQVEYLSIQTSLASDSNILLAVWLGRTDLDPNIRGVEVLHEMGCENTYIYQALFSPIGQT